MGQSVGDALLEPHINYTNHIRRLLDQEIEIKGIAHITGGGIVENIPRILPDNRSVNINLGSWPILPIFKTMQSIGSVDDSEMFRAFNMGIGMALITDSSNIDNIKTALKELTPVFEIGKVVEGDKEIIIA